MTRLVVDLGGTNVRAAIATGSNEVAVGRVHEGSSKTRESTLSVVAECLNSSTLSAPAEAVFALAGPVVTDPIQMPNLGWTFAIDEIRASVGLSKVTVVNDFVAVAMSIPYLAPNMVRSIDGNGSDARGNIAVLGPGTGLGVACLVPTAAGGVAFPGEGGHVTLSASDHFEPQLIEYLRDDTARSDGDKWNQHVSAERVLSGPGLVNLYKSVVYLETGKRPDAPRTPEEITSLAVRILADGTSANTPELRTVELFCKLLASFAGNVALTLGATGGVVLAGNIANSLLTFILHPSFRQRFTAKGRLASYLANIPLSVITHRCPALIGLANMKISDQPSFSLKPVQVHELRSSAAQAP
jgi:glucokinase